MGVVKITSQPTEAESALGFSFGVTEIRHVARIFRIEVRYMDVYIWMDMHYAVGDFAYSFIREMWFFDCSCINIQT